ncbi:MAG: TonB-dependent receptor [Pseudohongiella sp.]|nr:TonB-dependent receptor [Pseudohongiella sp.]
MKLDTIRSFTNRKIAIAVMTVMGVSGTEHAYSQQEAPAIEELVVVGSQIRGARITGALPVSVVGADQITATGAISGDDLFRSIPEAGDITFNGTYLGGGNSNAARGDVSTVSLRGLAQGNTLLLLNGRRSVVHPTAQTDNETPVFGYNVNALPVMGLERVEILKDGAAALYGSDAVAGVVNNVLRSDFTGAEMDVQYGSAAGKEWTANMVWGSDFAQGRGNMFVYAGTSKKDAILASDESYMATLDRRDQVVGTSFEGSVVFDQRGTGSAWGGFQSTPFMQVRSNGVAVTDVAGNFIVQPSGIPGCTYALNSGTCYGSGTVTTNPRREMRQDSRRIEGLAILPDTERNNVFSFINYELTEQLSFFGEVGYYAAETNALSTPPTSLASTPITIPANNYWNPFGPVGSPNRLPGLNIPDAGLPLTIRSYVFTDFGPRLVNVKNDQYRLLGGLRGDIGTWGWESAVLYNEANVRDSQEHASSTLTQQALAKSTPDAYNPFSGGDAVWWSNPQPPTANSADVARSFLIQAVRENNTKLTLWDLKLSQGELLMLPGGPVGMAGGIEFRREQYLDDRDHRQDTTTTYRDMVTGITYGSDLMGHSPSLDVKGSRNVSSAFIEFAIPVISPLQGIPLVQAIDVQLAGRYEDYNDVGSVAKPKVALAWDVVDGLRLRSSWSQGFKAPNLDVLNQQVLERLIGRRDNVRCEADLRAGRISNFSQCTASYGVPSQRAGNPNLKPEESESFSYGLVFDPQFLPAQFGSVTFTVDRWEIEQSGIVGVMDDQTAINLDYLQRLSGGSNPNVVRAMPTPADDLAYQGTGLTPVGEVLYVNAAFTNLLPLLVSGIDVGVVYEKDFDRIGNLNLNLNATKLTDFYQDADEVRTTLLKARQDGVINPGVPVTGATDLIGQNGNPEWKWTLSATWSLASWQVGFMTQYIDSVVQNAVLDANLNPWLVDSLQTYNLYGQYAFDGLFGGGKTTVKLGARNLTDRDPPLAQGGYLGNIHQPVGRYVYAGVRHAF